MKAPNWNKPQLEEMPTSQLETLRLNALRLGNAEITALCVEILASRLADRSAAKRQNGGDAESYVAGYHFICDRSRGVSHARNGIFWSGSWVVKEATAKQSQELGAYLALHEAKSEPSYLQGQVIGFRRAARSMIDKDTVGIKFQVRMSNKKYEWIGDGSGEKGYFWLPTNN